MIFFLNKKRTILYAAPQSLLILTSSHRRLYKQVSKSFKMNILAKVYLVHLKVEHCQTLRVVSTFTGQNQSTVFDWWLFDIVLHC